MEDLFSSDSPGLDLFALTPCAAVVRAAEDEAGVSAAWGYLPRPALQLQLGPPPPLLAAYAEAAAAAASTASAAAEVAAAVAAAAAAAASSSGASGAAGAGMGGLITIAPPGDGSFMPNPRYASVNAGRLIPSGSPAAAAAAAAGAGVGGEGAAGARPTTLTTPAPATTALALAMYEFVGKLMGISIRTKVSYSRVCHISVAAVGALSDTCMCPIGPISLTLKMLNISIMTGDTYAELRFAPFN